MKKLLFLASLFSVLSFGSQAQTRIQVAYSGTMILHPGINLDYSRNLTSQIRKKAEGQLVTRQLICGLQAGSYYHKHMHTGLYLTPHIEWVKTTRKGFQYGIDLPAGYLRTFIPRVYEVESSGAVKKKNFSGTNHFIVAPSFRVGKKLKHPGLIDEWYVRNKIMYMAPYPAGNTFRYFLEIGVTHWIN